MNKQIWTMKKAQDILKGDLISGRSQIFALEVISVRSEDEKVFVQHYNDLYRYETPTYEFQRNQLIPVAVSGVKHGDIITNHFTAS